MPLRQRNRKEQLGSGPADLRRHNRALVLRAIRDRAGVSRAELARLTNLSGPAISAIVGELIESRLVHEDGFASSNGGRRAATLRLTERARTVVAVDLARHRTRVALVDLGGTVLEHVDVLTSDRGDGAANVQWLNELIARVLARGGEHTGSLLGIGVGAPGPLSTSTGEILWPTHFGHWHNLPLRSELERTFGLPVRVDNDANACALAQRWFGAGRTMRNFVYVAVGSGVGSGVVVDGEIYRGAHDLAGEIGHCTVDVSGPPCPCGNVGCLELYATLRATLARWLGAARPETADDEIAGIRDLIRAAHSGDETARAAITMSAQYLGVGVINVINAFDPETVFLGRELAAAGDLLLSPIRSAVARRAFASTGRVVPIETDPLGVAAPLLGAACLVLRDLFVDGNVLAGLIRAPSVPLAG